MIISNRRKVGRVKYSGYQECRGLLPEHCTYHTIWGRPKAELSESENKKEIRQEQLPSSVSTPFLPSAAVLFLQEGQKAVD